MKIIIVLILSFLFCDEEDKYTFFNKLNEGKVLKYKHGQTLSFEIGGIGLFVQGSDYVLISEYLGGKDGFHIFQNTIANLVEVSLVNEKMRAGFDLNKIKDVAHKIIINNNGRLDHVESEDSYLNSVLEKHYMAAGAHNYLFPFGRDANNLSIGDSWTEVLDSIEIHLDDDSPTSLMSIETIYTLDKIKTKKGKNIAFISSKSEVKMDISLIVDNEFLEGTSSGTDKSKYRYDIAAGELIWMRTSTDCLMEYKFQDRTIKTPQSFTYKIKKIK